MKFNFSNLSKKLQTQKGFSLVGVIVAFFIAIVGIVSVLALFSISLKGFTVAQDKLVASHLAQEGIETVRYIRRLNEDSESRWSNWYDSLFPGSRNYRVVYDNNNLISYSDTPLKINSSGFYQYDSGENTKFYRKLTLQKIASNQLKVIVEIKWLDRNGEWSYLIAEDRLWDWR